MNQDNSEQNSTATTIAKYWSGKLYRQVLGAVVSFLRPKLLSPEYYGVWTILKLIRRYASYSHLGTRSALRYLIPLYESREDETTVGALHASGFFFGLGVTILIAVGVMLAALAPGFTRAVRAGLISMGILVILRYYHHFLLSLLKAEEAFGIITRSIYVMVTLTFVTTVPLLYFFDIYGIYASVIIAETGTIVFLRLGYSFRERGTFEWSAVLTLLRKGFPIIVLNLAIALVTTCDRIIVGAMMGKEALGYYGIAIMGMAFLMEIPGTARSVMEPRLMRTLEKRPDDAIVRDYLVSPMMKTVYLLPFLVGPSFLAMEAGVTFLLPRYTAGVPAARTLALGVPLLALAYVPRMLIIARDWQLAVCWRVPPILLVNVVLGVLLVKAGYGLFGIALATILAFGLLFMVLFAFLRVKLENWPTGDQWVLKLLPPVALMCMLVVVLSSGIPLLISNLYWQAIISVAVFGIIYAGFYHFAAARTDILPPLKPWSML